jgi:hypothetical protein
VTGSRPPFRVGNGIRASIFDNQIKEFSKNYSVFDFIPGMIEK